MDFLSNLSKKDEPSNAGPNDPTNTDHGNLKSTQSNLIHSAKVVADVAQAHLRHEPEKYDKAEVAGATADLLSAAAEYGKLGDKGVGKYVDKAEDYLRHYNGSQPDVSTGDQKAHVNSKITTGGEEHAGGEGLSKKPSSQGDFLKNMAGDFLKK